MFKTSDIIALGFDPVCFKFVRMRRKRGVKAVSEQAGIGRSVVLALEAGRSVRTDHLRILRYAIRS